MIHEIPVFLCSICSRHVPLVTFFATKMEGVHVYRVGGCTHVPFGQHHDDECVGHDGDDQQQRHDVSIEG